MQVYGQLIKAQLETLSGSDGAAVAGSIWFRSDLTQIKLYNGASNVALLANDEKCILGSAVGAADNVRLHRGGSALLQFVTADNTTTDGTLTADLAKLSFKFESYALAGLPTVGKAGRVVYVTDALALYYDNGTTWEVVGSGSGGGGGGGSLTWVEGINSPTKEVSALGDLNYIFSAGEAQQLYILIKVPTGYTAGDPITLKTTFHSNDTSGTLLLKTEATLIRTNSDAINGTSNQHISVNTAVTLSGGTQNIPQSISLDLTEADGEINGVAVSPGHLIRIRFYRDTDTATGDVNVPVSGTEITFA